MRFTGLSLLAFVLAFLGTMERPTSACAWTRPPSQVKLGMTMKEVQKIDARHDGHMHNAVLLSLLDIGPNMEFMVFNEHDCSEDEAREGPSYLLSFENSILVGQRDAHKWLYDSLTQFKSDGIDGFFIKEWSGGAHC